MVFIQWVVPILEVWAISPNGGAICGKDFTTVCIVSHRFTSVHHFSAILAFFCHTLKGCRTTLGTVHFYRSSLILFLLISSPVTTTNNYLDCAPAFVFIHLTVSAQEWQSICVGVYCGPLLNSGKHFKTLGPEDLPLFAAWRQTKMCVRAICHQPIQSSF